MKVFSISGAFLAFLFFSVFIESQRISLKFKDADIKDVLLIMAEIGRTNIIIDPSVKGKVTVNLKDVEWESALESILVLNGLGYIKIGNSGIVAGYDSLVYKVSALGLRRSFKHSFDRNTIVTLTFPLSLEKAKAMGKEIGKILSAKGRYQYNTKTNCVMITDYAENAEKALRRIRYILGSGE